ncbi:bpX6 domain-containing protein [Lysobacter antibioticus]|uniref:MoxR-vWA-beta-propeller ternary system domain-containing protein n=1 Tax=Lysobacter antibioticus TaxID=84531 RepID=A0A0S2F8U8_LYSAN|nr:bpX6 domain-containing protein [Lysobacter antibioticus]ALN79980.1 hypothetical protein LA76x_1828 [Lysobacter antibioticus]
MAETNTNAGTQADTAVRHPVWRGWQPVAGLWFGADWLAPERRAERILQAWRMGCRAWRFDDGDVLCFDQVRPMQCSEAAGVPLCRIGAHGLYAGPLTADELAALAPADVQLVVGGRLQPLHFAQAQALDPSLVIDIDDYALHDTYDGRLSLRPTRHDRLAGKRVREVLGDRIPPPSKEQGEFLRRARGGAGADAPPSLRERVTGTRDGMADWLLRRFPGLSGEPAQARGGHAGTQARNGAAATLRARSAPRAPQAWRSALVRFAMASRASKLIGMRQGAYLRRMMAQFEKGDLGEALRNALPIDGRGDSLGQAFGTPGRRGDLSLGGERQAATDINLGDYEREHLRKLYRQAFDKLDRQGQIDEAVFVLAELLNARQEALDYLVRHQRHAQAAELALSWDMPAETIIRLLMLSGDSERAILVARRDNAFAAAIAMLEKDHPEHARRLRGEWGQALVERGQWLAAVDAVWPEPELREQAGRWLLAAEAAGDELSARALVQRATLLPDTIERYAERIATLADPASPPLPRAALAEALLAAKSSGKAVRMLATRVLPALAADRAACANALDRQHLERLLKLSGDPWLRADLPAWGVPAVAGRKLWESQGEQRWQAPAAGLHTAHDVVAIGEGRYLAALGEAGVAVIDRHGRSVRRYAVPAYKLAIADSLQVALAIAPREAVSRIARLDLAHHEIADLGVMPIQFAADRYDGIAWSLVSNDRLLVVDAARPALDVLWSVSEPNSRVIAAEYFAADELFLIQDARGASCWHYRLPRRSLRSRDAVPESLEQRLRLHPITGAQLLDVSADDDGMRLAYSWSNYRRSVQLSAHALGKLRDCSIKSLANGFLVGLYGEEAMRFHLVRFNDAASLAAIDWPYGASVSLREQDGRLLLYDDQGRVLDIDTQRTQVHGLSLL